MRIHIFEAGKSRASRAVDVEVEVQHATLRIGGAPPCEVVVPGLGPAPAAEIRVVAGMAELFASGQAPVEAAGLQVPSGQAVPLGPELLLVIGGKELVYRSTPSAGGAPAATPPAGGGAYSVGNPMAPPGGALTAGSGSFRPQAPGDATPSAIAKDMLKDVYAALGVPENAPALVVYDKDNKVVRRVDLVPPFETILIGRRPDAGIVLYHQSVSKEHAEVMRDGVGFVVKDLGSRNGTQLNNRPVKGIARLTSGDRITVGQFTVRFVDPKATMQDLAESVPDLKRIERAKPGEPVRVGGPGDLEATSSFQESMRRKGSTDGSVAEGSAGEGSGGAAPAPGGGGGSPVVFVILSLAVLVLLGLIAAIVMTL